MPESDFSTCELVSYSEAYQRALRRGFNGSKSRFRTLATQEPDRVAEEFGVWRDTTLVNPTIDQPTWRDLRTGSAPKLRKTRRTRTRSAAKAVTKPTTTAPPADITPAEALDMTNRDLDLVHKLSTGIDFLTREAEAARRDRDIAVSERDRLKAQWDGEQTRWQEEVDVREHQIDQLQQRIEQLQLELQNLRETYQALEPLLEMVDKAQTQLQNGSQPMAAEGKEDTASASTATVAPPAEVEPPKSQPVEPEATSSTSPRSRSRSKSSSRSGTKSRSKSESPSSSRAKSKSKSESKSPPKTESKAKSRSKSRSDSKTSSKSKPGPKPSSKSKSDAQSKAPSSSRKELDSDANRALEAIMEYNNQPGRSLDEKWAISYPVMKDLLTQVGSSTQSKIRAVFEARRGEIERHHRQHDLGERHNRKHSGESISNFIQL